MSWRRGIAAVVLAASGVFAGGASAAHGPGAFTLARATAGSGFMVNGSIGESGLVPLQSVTYTWSAHVVVGFGCGGKSVTQNLGRVLGTLGAQADAGGMASSAFSIGLPGLSCANGATPAPVKMIVRSIKIVDTTNHLRARATGWFISKDSKGFTSAHPFH